MRSWIAGVVSAALAAGALLLLRAPLAAQEEQGQLVTRQGPAGVRSERFTRTGDRLHAEVRTALGQQLSYVASMRPDGTVGSLDAFIWPQGINSAAGLRHVQVEFAGEGARLHVSDVGPTLSRDFAAPAGTLPVITGDLVLLELLLRRARASGGARVELPVLSLDLARLTSATVTFTGDTADVRIEGRPELLRFRTDAAGHLLGGAEATGGLTFLRIG
ncbi:MAG TPA: hypothetical protein VF832_06970, partial [Longimicrobiales bacterium]